MIAGRPRRVRGVMAQPRPDNGPRDGRGTPPGKREQNKQANRSALLEAACRCFLRMGYDAVTVRDILRQTDLAVGTFYNYFPDKEALLRELLELHINDVNARMQAVRQQAPSIEAFIHGAYLIFFRKVREEPDFFGLILRNEYAARTLFQDTVVGIPMRALKADIRDAIARGVFPSTDVDLLASAFYGTGFEISRLMMEQPSIAADAAADFATTLLTRGLPAFGALEAGAAG